LPREKQHEADDPPEPARICAGRRRPAKVRQADLRPPGPLRFRENLPLGHSTGAKRQLTQVKRLPRRFCSPDICFILEKR